MNYYAPELDAYYRRRRTSRDTVRAERDEAFDRYDEVDVRITNTSIQLDDTGRNAVATFDKTWRFEGDEVSRGKVRQQLDLRKLDDDRWVITGERDLRVYDEEDSAP